MRNTRYWFYVVAVFIQLILAPHLLATTYYIAANGSDANNGTSKTTPWLHAPGMSTCTNTCGSTTPAAGDNFIFRGGDVWHYGNSTLLSYTGGSLRVSQSGTSGNPIYYGVDLTWFVGGSWTRPIMNRDNPLSTSQVSSCTFNDDGGTQVSASGNFVTIDNFEFIGHCWTNPAFGSGIIGQTGTNDILDHVYIHGWTHAACPGGTCDTSRLVIYGGSSTGKVLSNSVLDGSDSPPNSGFAVYYYGCGDFHNNVFRYLSNGIVCGTIQTVHDNLFEHINESYDGQTHGNVVEWLNGVSNITVYNNVIRHITNLGVTLWISPSSGSSLYFYNNLIYDLAPSGAQSANCVMISNGSAGGTQNFNIYNNTINAPCQINYASNSGTPCPTGTVTYSNNHFVGYGSLPRGGNCGTGTVTEVQTTNLYMSTATSDSQGYTSSGICANDTSPCAPTSQSNATVGTGTNQTSSCATFGSALCSGTTLGVIEVAGNVAIPARTTIARPSSGAWDKGAYQYSASAGSAPQPPTSLAATVN